MFSSFPEGKFLVTKFEFGGSFGMSLDGDCHEIEVTPNLKLLVTFEMSLKGVCHELPNFTTSLYLIWRQLKIHRKSSLLIRYEEVMSLK
jgi:hypothetical protein